MIVKNVNLTGGEFHLAITRFYISNIFILHYLIGCLANPRRRQSLSNRSGPLLQVLLLIHLVTTSVKCIDIGINSLLFHSKFEVNIIFIEIEYLFLYPKLSFSSYRQWLFAYLLYRTDPTRFNQCFGCIYSFLS